MPQDQSFGTPFPGAAARIAVRVDVSARIGTGHLKRCLSLARSLAEAGAEVRFLLRGFGIDLAATFAGYGLPYDFLPAPEAQDDPAAGSAGWAGVDQLQDAAETLARLADWRPDWVVVDHYSFAAPWHEAVAAGLGCRIAAIDDLGDRPLAAALLIDHNVCADHRARHAASLRPGTRLLAGPRYALIDPLYATAPRYPGAPEVRSIGIFMGGIDADGHSLPIARALRETAGFSGPIAIATTSGNPALGALAGAAEGLGIALCIDQPDLAGFFAAHDLQIGAAGGATWERCCIGAPTLAVAVADNQREILPPLEALGAVSALAGAVEPVAVARAAKALIDAPDRRRDLSLRARALVDGLGTVRVAAALLAGHVGVRPATLADARMMHDWRNDPAVRAVSRQPDPIPFASHLAWLEATLGRADRRLFIAGAATRPIGVVRFDLGGDETEVSIYLDPALTGLGLGGAVLAAAERGLARGLATPVTLRAETLPDNHGSRRLFEAAGYESEGDRFRKRLAPCGSEVHV